MEESVMSDLGPALVMINPRAAGGRAQALHEPLTRWLQVHAPCVSCVTTASVDAARAAIRQQAPGSRTVLVGGDGTVHQMLPALVEQGCELGLVPLGSGNDCARALGLARLDWAAALAHALQAPATPMDLGRCNAEGRLTWFASSLTAGFDSAVGERAVRSPARLRGLPRYLWATLGELAFLRHWPMTITCDGSVLHEGAVLFASVLNTPTYGSGMPVVPQARIDDGRLELLLAGPFSRLGTAVMLPRMLAGRHLGHPMVRIEPFTALEIRSPVAVPLAGDGEPAGTAREWQITVQPGALRVVRCTDNPPRQDQQEQGSA
jgi:YegS/Rv2252/BmrU family lipid kinase